MFQSTVRDVLIRKSDRDKDEDVVSNRDANRHTEFQQQKPSHRSP